MSESVYDMHEVTTKAALYSPDLSSVLALRYLRNPRNEYGLPGGHVDAAEDPDTAMQRELREELNLVDVNLSRADFFVHASGKIVLAYTGVIDINTQIDPSDPDREVEVWLKPAELEQTDMDPGYKEFALKFWPKK